MAKLGKAWKAWKSRLQADDGFRDDGVAQAAEARPSTHLFAAVFIPEG